MEKKPLTPFYAAEVERLSKLPVDEIISHWSSRDTGLPGSPLFAYTTPSGRCDSAPGGGYCGCLTQVRNSYKAWTPELTSQIRSDARLPVLQAFITVESLQAFAEWQQRLDEEIRPVPLEQLYANVKEFNHEQ